MENYVSAFVFLWKCIIFAKKPKQNKGGLNTFVRERECFAKVCQVSLGNTILLQENANVFSKRTPSFSREHNTFARKQIFAREHQVSLRNAILLQGNTKLSLSLIFIIF